MTTRTATINHADYSNRPSFARVVEAAFTGVSVLPNAEVMSACLRSGGRRAQPVVIDVLHDGDLRTAYRVGGEFGELIVIDAADGSWERYDLGDSDPDVEESVAAVMTELADTEKS